VIIAVLSTVSCSREPEVSTTVTRSACSLLDIAPCIGMETELRDPPPATSRLVIDENSMEGWLNPPENILRFPVSIEEDAHLSARLGIDGEFPEHLDDIIFRINFINKDGVSQALYETSLRQNPDLPQNWLDIDIILAQIDTANTELTFEVTPANGDISSLQILWGAPVIYYPGKLNHRNVLLIGIDALRADSLSVYGGRTEVSPNIQSFSTTATIFDQSRSQSSWTLPSFASIVTGGLPSVIGTTIHSGRIPADAETIGETLRPYGYATATICGNTYLGNRQSGFHQGFDELWFRFSATPQASVGRTIDFIRRNSDRDWMIFLHIMDPHGPYTPPEEYTRLLADPGYGGPYGEAFHDADVWKSLETPPSADDIRQVRDLYDAEVANVDAAVGELFAFLDEQGLTEDTLIIITADHGEEFFDHGDFEHGHTHFDEMVRTPLLVRGPGFSQDRRIDTCVGNYDIVPTILDYLAVEAESNLPGIPLQDVVGGTVGNDRIILGEGNNRGTHRKFAVTWPYKCILDFVTGNVRLYNLEDDPGETTDISESEQEITSNLSQAMALAMLPDNTIFHIWFMGSPDEAPRRFSGTLEFSCDVGNVRTFGLGEYDIFEIEGSVITFDISNEVPAMGVDKHLTISPLEDDVTVDANVLVDHLTSPDYFFPYGTPDPEPSGHAIVSINDYPLGQDMPMDEVKLRPGMYIWGVKGFDRDEQGIEMDPEELEQLRSLNYI